MQEAQVPAELVRVAPGQIDARDPQALHVVGEVEHHDGTTSGWTSTSTPQWVQA